MAELSYGAAVAVELPVALLPLELSFGVAARRLHRWRITDRDDLLGFDDILADDFTERYFDPEDPWASVSEGKGYVVDIGALGSFNDAINLAVVVENLITKMEYKDGTEDEFPAKFGISSAVDLTELTHHGAADVDVMLAGGVNSSKETRLGLEIIWDMPLLKLSGRIGSNEGHMTLGAGIQLAFLDVDYAFYGDEDTNWHAFSLNLSF